MPTSTLRINARVASMKPSATLAMSARAKELRRQGRPVLALSAGEPDFDTPAPIAEAGVQAIRDGFTHYTENMGMRELREAISRKLEQDNGITATPDQILCSNGAKQSVALTAHVLSGPGDEVLIPAPHWVSYPEMVRFAGAEPVVLPARVENQYRLTPDQLREAITDRTRLLIFCSPSNPTGAVYSPDELAALAEVILEHDELYVLSDEIYEHVVYGAEHLSIGSLPGMAERTITVNGFSKAYAMTGWRLGYMAGPQPIVKAAAKIQGQLTSAPSSISQMAGIAALEMGTDPIREMVAAFRERRDFVLDQLTAIDGLNCPTPEGAFYCFPEVSSFYGRKTPQGKKIGGSEDLCFYLLEEHDVALVPGSAFGYDDGIRLSYASGMETLREALQRIRNGLGQLQ